MSLLQMQSTRESSDRAVRNVGARRRGDTWSSDRSLLDLDRQGQVTFVARLHERGSIALRVARGLLRLWLVLSVLWIGGVGVVTWQTFPPEIPERASFPYLCELNKDCSWLDRVKNQLDMDKEQRAAIQSAVVLALAPPAFLLTLGSALVWAFRGFR
jgi:hypothetical protein